MSERFVDVYLLLLIDFKLLISKVYVGEHHQVSAIRLISLRAIVEIVSPLVPFTGQWEFVIETFNKRGKEQRYKQQEAQAGDYRE